MLPQNKSIQEIPIIYFVGEAAEEKQQAKAKLSREDTLKLNSKQVTSFRDIVLKETEKWKKCIQKNLGKKKLSRVSELQRNKLSAHCRSLPGIQFLHLCLSVLISSTSGQLSGY